MLIPNVIEKTKNWERVYDIYSRLLEDRIIFVWQAIESRMANTIIAQMLFLEKQDSKKDIVMYINSPWWEVSAWLAIYDTMQYIKCDIATISVGMSASMWAILVTAWTKNKRFILPNSEIMIHQPLWGAQWQASDIEIAAKHILDTKSNLNKILSKHTWQTIKKIEIDVERDNWMRAKEAVKYWLVDKII